MSDPRITDEVVQAATLDWYAANYLSWAEAGKFEQAAALARTRSTLTAALPHLAPQPVVDREALLDAIQPTESTGLPSRQRAIADAVMEVVRPMPTWDQIAEALYEYDRGAMPTRDPWSETFPVIKANYRKRADAVLALLNGTAK